MTKASEKMLIPTIEDGVKHLREVPTKREMFAAMILQGMAANGVMDVIHAVDMAEYLIEHLDKEE